MISHTSKCIFIHIPKTGGSSVEYMFSMRDGNYLPWEKHIKASVASRAYGLKWEEYTKFSIVRNPWDRVYSLWYNYRVDGKWDMSFVDFLSLLPIDDIMFDTQFDWLQVDGKIAVDYVYRFEDVPMIYHELISRYVLEVDNIPHAKEKKGKPNYKAFYNDETKKIVSEVYAKDIETWGYEFE